MRVAEAAAHQEPGAGRHDVVAAGSAMAIAQSATTVSTATAACRPGRAEGDALVGHPGDVEPGEHVDDLARLEGGADDGPFEIWSSTSTSSASAPKRRSGLWSGACGGARWPAGPRRGSSA